MLCFNVIVKLLSVNISITKQLFLFWIGTLRGYFEVFVIAYISKTIFALKNNFPLIGQKGQN